MLPTTSQESRTKTAHDSTSHAAASPALEWLWQRLREVRRPHVLECGCISRATAEVLLRRRAKLYVADLIAQLQRGGTQLWDRRGKTLLFRLEDFLAQVPKIPPESLSAIFCWQLLDLLPRDPLPAIVGRLWSYLQPGGSLFCVLRQPYLTTGADKVWRLESLTTLVADGDENKPFPYAALTNREMERLIPAGSVKTFLTRSGRREVLGIK